MTDILIQLERMKLRREITDGSPEYLAEKIMREHGFHPNTHKEIKKMLLEAMVRC